MKKKLKLLCLSFALCFFIGLEKSSAIDLSDLPHDAKVALLARMTPEASHNLRLVDRGFRAASIDPAMQQEDCRDIIRTLVERLPKVTVDGEAVEMMDEDLRNQFFSIESINRLDEDLFDLPLLIRLRAPENLRFLAKNIVTAFLKIEDVNQRLLLASFSKLIFSDSSLKDETVWIGRCWCEFSLEQLLALEEHEASLCEGVITDRKRFPEVACRFLAKGAHEIGEFANAFAEIKEDLFVLVKKKSARCWVLLALVGQPVEYVQGFPALIEEVSPHLFSGVEEDQQGSIISALSHRTAGDIRDFTKIVVDEIQTLEGERLSKIKGDLLELFAQDGIDCHSLPCFIRGLEKNIAIFSPHFLPMSFELLKVGLPVSKLWAILTLEENRCERLMNSVVHKWKRDAKRLIEMSHVMDSVAIAEVINAIPLAHDQHDHDRRYLDIEFEDLLGRLQERHERDM